MCGLCFHSNTCYHLSYRVAKYEDMYAFLHVCCMRVCVYAFIFHENNKIFVFYISRQYVTKKI